MANDLTGDFDVVAEFAVPAINRLLAAMHRNERFPHALSLSVDDTPPVGPPRNSVVGVVDGFGDPIASHAGILPVRPLGGVQTATDPVAAALGQVVNVGTLVATGGTIVPSLIKGRLQVQLAAPTISLPAGAPSSVTATFAVLARFLPDRGTPPLAEFIRGLLQLTTTVKPVTSSVANVVEVDIKGSDVVVGFTELFTSSPFSAEDLAGVLQLIKNALKNSFLPSSATLPPTIQSLQLKSLAGPPGAVAVLVKLAGSASAGPGDPGTVQNVFLGAGDGFAFGVGSDFIQAAFNPVTSALVSQPIAPVSFDVSFVVTVHATYAVTINAASIALLPGKIQLTIQGHADASPSFLPSFDYTVLQDFTLQANGDTADLVVGDASISTTSSIANLFSGTFLDRLKPLRDQVLDQTGVRQSVRDLLNADENLGPFIASLLTPTRPTRPGGQTVATGLGGAAARLPPPFDLRYTSVEIRPSGIVLHGEFDVADWPAAIAEFEPLPSTQANGAFGLTSDLFSHGPDYTAFKSWIPGGAVESYSWATQGQGPPFVDQNRFVLLSSGPAATAAAAPGAAAAVAANPAFTPFAPLCLTVQGSRLSSSGPVVAQPVSATVCGYTVVSVLGEIAAPVGAAPLVALTRAGAGGLVEVTGHAAAAADQTGLDTPTNRVVVFGDHTVAEQLTHVMTALAPTRGGREVTAVLAVIPPGQLAKTRHVPGVIYADDHGGAWEKLFRIEGHRRPLTLIVTAKGAVTYRHEGPLEPRTLAAALHKHLVPGTRVRLPGSRLPLRLGQLAPDFLFQPAAGQQLTLRKARGPLTLVFWRSSSAPSIQAVQDAQGPAGRPAGSTPSVLAVNDGESVDLATKAAAQHHLSALLVTDPQRLIAQAYGVAIWPTRVDIDAAGLVSAVQYGRETEVAVG
jgi:hypothetical protein